MAMHELGSDVVPTPSEITNPVRQWQRELDDIHAHFDALKQTGRATYEAEKVAIADSVREKREEHLSRLKADIHQYMKMVQEDMDTLLAELQAEKLRRLSDEFDQRQKSLDKERDHHLLHHLKGYRVIAEAPPDKSVDRPEVPEERLTTQPAKIRTPLPADRRTTPQKPDVAPAPKMSGFQAVNGPRRKSKGTDDHVAGAAMDAKVEQGVPAGRDGHTHAPSPHPQPNGVNGKPIEAKPSIKRKAPEEAGEDAKRARTDQGNGTPTAAGSKDVTPRRRRLPSLSEQRDRPEQPVNPDTSEAAEKRTISFDEVYQDGNADYKHTIVEFPQDSNKWYILRCDLHGVHFGLQPLLGAAKHLHSSQHGNLPKHHALAVDLLGHFVFDCDKKLAEMNNAAVKKAFVEGGYTPYNVNRLTRTQRLNQGLPANGNGSPSRPSPRPKPIESNPAGGNNVNGDIAGGASQKSPRPFTGLTNPVPGELYLGYWTKTKSKFAIVVLPLTGSVGVTSHASGSLHSIGLLPNAPRCFTVNKATHTITGWAKGYEDGGPLVTKREFPVVYFDHKHQVGWLPVRCISRFDFDDPKGPQIPEFYTARNDYARHRGYEDYEAMRAQRNVPGLDVNGGKDYFGASVPADGSSSLMVVDAPENPRQAAGYGDGPSREPGVTLADAESSMDLDGNETEEETDRHRDADQRQQGVVTPGPSSAPGGTTTGTPVSGKRILANQHRATPSATLLEPPKTAQEIAARALHLSPERDTPPSARVEANQSTIDAAQVATAVMAFQAVNAPDARQGPASRSSKIQDLLGANISPVRHRPSIRVGDHANGFSPSKSLSPTTNTERPALPARAPSAQPILDSIAAAPRKVLLGGPSAGGLGDASSTVLSANPAGGFDRLLHNGSNGQPAAIHTENEQPNGTTSAEKPPVRSVEGDFSRSASVNPSSGSAAGSPKAAQTILKGDGVNRWKAVRNGSFSGSPQPSAGSFPGAADTSDSTPKDPTLSPASVSAPYIKADPDRTQDFDIVSYHGDSRRWVREADGPYLRLSVGAESKIAETGDNEALHVTVDPYRVANMVSEATDATGATAVEMTTKEGSKNRQRLVFETKTVGGRLESGKLQARRFCQWVLSVNPSVAFRPSHSDSPRRLSMQGSKESPVAVD